MLLTIGMIVKNEEKYLDRCLTALSPVLEKVDSELIVADTGSTDSTVEIARKFTDKVLHFEWINDFAAARNCTLEKAQGKWFMFVDADEIFTSCDEIISFFNSGEYRNFNSASYIVRNLPKEGRGAAVDFTAPRLTKILPDTRFIHPVHECYSTYGNPVKTLNDVACHYGYTAESSEEKFKRNSALLMKRLNEEQPSAMLYQQLYDCFASHDGEKALRYLDEGIEFCIKNKHPLLVSMYQSKANHLFGEKKYAEVLDVCGKYFAADKDVLTTDIEMHGFMATSLNCLGRHAEAVKEYVSFFKKFGEYKSGRLVTEDIRYTRIVISNDINISALFSEFLSACIRANSSSAETAADFPLYKYPIKGERLSAIVEKELVLLSACGYSRASAFYGNLPESGKTVFERLLRGRIALTAENGAIISALGSLSDENKLIADIYRSISGGEAPEGLKKISDINSCADILYTMLKTGADISPFVTAEGFSPDLCARRCAESFSDFYDYAAGYKAQYVKNPAAFAAAAELFGCIARLAARNGQKTDHLLRIYGEFKAMHPKTELELLSEKVKTNIYSFIASGNLSAAVTILTEYQKINPADPDIRAIETLIAEKRR